MAEAENSPRRVTAKERQNMVYELHLGGYSYREIAGMVGYAGPSGAHKAHEAALRRLIEEPLLEMRETNVRRLIKLLSRIWMQVQKGSLPAIDRAVKIIQELNKLGGLYAPQRFEHDWREILEREGIDATEQFEEMVAYFAERMNERN